MCPSIPEYPPDRDRLKIRAFYLRLSAADDCRPQLPDSLTLVFLRRIDGIFLEVNGSRVRPDAPAIIPLQRVRSAESGRAEAVFASTVRVRAAEGVRFEAFVGAEKVVKGVFRRSGGWKMECWCPAEGDLATGNGVAEAEVVVVEEEKGAVMTEKVEVASAEKRRRRRRRRGFSLRLEEIPEESDGCDCLCCEGGEEWEMVGSDGADWKDAEGQMDGPDHGLDMEGVRWAVDAGIWVMCLGVGLLVSSASYKGLKRRLF